jgi:hypothetical protein
MYSNAAAVSRPELTTYLEEAPDLEKGLIAKEVLPIYTSSQRAGRYPRIKSGNGGLLDIVTGDRRAPSGSYNRTDRKWDWDTFDTEDRGSEEAIPDVLVKEMDAFFDMEKITSKLVARANLFTYEKDVADLVMSPANSGFTATAAGTAYTEANIATFDFVADIQDAHARLEAKGYSANTLVLSRALWNRISRSTKLQTFMFGHLSNTGNANITLPALSDKLMIDKILICGRSYNAAKKGQTQSLSSLWGTSYALLINVQSGDFANGGAGRTIVWGADSPGGLFTTETYREENVRGDVVRVRSNRALKVVDSAAAELITTSFA